MTPPSPGYAPLMAINKHDTAVLTASWSQAREGIRMRYPQIVDDDFGDEGNLDFKSMTEAIATRTGEKRSDVEKTIKDVASTLEN